MCLLVLVVLNIGLSCILFVNDASCFFHLFTTAPLPLPQFVEMESKFAYNIVHLVDQNMKALKKVVFGSGLLTPQIQANAAAMLANQVPRHWEKMWEGPEMPLSFLKAIVQKKTALSSWGPNMKSLSKSGGSAVKLNLSELFNPGTFLMALRQQTARVARLPMDSLILSSSFGKELDDAPLPVTLGGLLMQGATYEDGRIELSGAGASEMCTMSGCTLAFTKDNSRDHGKGGRGDGKLDVPLYFSPTREKLLTAIAVDAKGKSDDWIIAGVALFLDVE